MISFGARMGSGYEFKLSISSLVRLRVATPFFMYFFISVRPVSSLDTSGYTEHYYSYSTPFSISHSKFLSTARKSLQFDFFLDFWTHPLRCSFGASGFVIYWMLQWCGMLAL